MEPMSESSSEDEGSFVSDEEENEEAEWCVSRVRANPALCGDPHARRLRTRRGHSAERVHPVHGNVVCMSCVCARACFLCVALVVCRP